MTWHLVGLLVPTLLVAGCVLETPETEDDCNTCEEQGVDSNNTPEDNDRFSIWAERLDEMAVINLEFLPSWSEPDTYGWHVQQQDLIEDVALEASLDWVDDVLAEHESFDSEDVTCVRANITYGEDCEDNPDQGHCQWACEGNGQSAHLTVDIEFNWPGQWKQTLWSHPNGVEYGCSLLFCQD